MSSHMPSTISHTPSTSTSHTMAMTPSALTALGASAAAQPSWQPTTTPDASSHGGGRKKSLPSVAQTSNSERMGHQTSNAALVEQQQWQQEQLQGQQLGQRQLSAANSNAVDVTGLIWDRKLSNLTIPWSDIKINENRVLGRGGFGTVYEGLWQGVIPVAVKLLNTDMLHAHALDTLRREALIMCEMHHPCIATVYGLVDDDTRHALVMRFYKRGTLAAAVSRPAYQSLGLTGRLRIAQQVASGMRRLHERRPAPVIHGDLKTSNVLVDDDGKGVAIADFGLACCLREGQSGQAISSGALTVSISPPEVLEDPSAPRTTAGDVYAFALVLLEVVSGRPAFRGMSRRVVISAVLAGSRPAIHGSVPDDVAEIITCCWAQRAADRPTFAAVCARLAEVVERHVESGADSTATMTLDDLTMTS